MKKKGFTLIELLAVIVILAVIALIATPLIMNVINDARKNSFKDSAYGIIKAVEFRAAKEQIDQVDGQNREYKVDVTSDAITYSGDKPTSGWAHIDANGNIELYMCNNTSYCASKAIDSSEVTITSDNNEMETIQGEITRVSELDIAMLTKDGSEGGYVKPVNNCTFDGELVQGAEYVNGQYTYRYMQHVDFEDENIVWNNFPENYSEGWGVLYNNDAEQSSNLMCSSINGLPIISMRNLYNNKSISNVDLSQLNTSQVEDMSYMFANIYNIEKIDLSSFETGNVKTMEGMFNCNEAPELVLSSFDTSSVTNMKYMFSYSYVIDPDLSSFNTSNVTTMEGMFWSCYSDRLDLSGFNTSNVTNMNGMFSEMTLQELDLSSFDLTNVNQMSGMFVSTFAPNAYAKNQADADKLNASPGKPSTLVFTVK